MPGRSPFATDPLPVSIGGWRYAVPHRPAADWITAMEAGRGPYDCIVPLLDYQSRDHLLDRLARGQVSSDDVAAASHRLIEECAPWRWWETYRLLMVSLRPQVLGRTVTLGMDARSLTVAQWSAGVFSLLTRGLDQTELFKFESRLAEPPEGVDDGDDWAMQDFDLMVAQARAMPGQHNREGT